MDIAKLKKRNPNMDILRIIAAFSVLSVHFFLHNGFYSQPITGAEMFAAVIMRTLFGVCVPLFIILTGYLMSNKTLSRTYYKGISKTLIIFVIATLACMVYKTIKYNEPFTPASVIFETLDFTGANYSWYIEMYIGLFLIAPFLNLAYNKLESQKKKQVLVLTFVALTILPTVFNIFNFETAAWWTNPTSSDEFQKLVPSWWMGFYPVTYYFVGCYLREYNLKMKTGTAFALLGASLLIFSGFNYFRSYDTTFKTGIYAYWYGIEPFVLAVLVFVLISRIKTDNLGSAARTVLWKLSDCALGIYLISYIFDEIVYDFLNKNVAVMTDRLPYYLVTVPIVFALSAISSFIMNIIAKAVIILFDKICAYIKLQKEQNKKEFWQDVLFIALFAGGLIFSVWKAFYGFGGNDEAFYLTVADRLVRGEALFVDEWHLSQMSGFLLVPFVALYKLICGSSEGIMLAARFVYIFAHGCVSYVLYSRIRKYGILSAVAAAFYFIYTPYNIMALSYNTMGLDLVVLCGVIMGTFSFKKKLPIIIAGVAFAGAVLCCPYLAMAYLMYIICVIVHYIIKKKNLKFTLSSEIFEAKVLLWFTVGVGILAVVFLAFVLPRSGISNIIDNLPHLLTDPEHIQMPFSYKFKKYFEVIWSFREQFWIPVSAYALMLFVMVLDKKRRSHRGMYLIVSCAAAIYTYVLIVPELTSSSYHFSAFPMMFIAITSYILIKNKPRNMFVSLFSLGIIYSFAISYSSNQYFYVIAMALTASVMSGMVFLNCLLKEMKEEPDNFDYPLTIKRCSAVGVVLVTVLMCGFQIKAKAGHCFWEFGMDTLTHKISEGPAKGILTTPANKSEYEKIYEDIQSYNNAESGNILFLTEKTWCYLATDMPYGTFSAWISGERESSLDRLADFYQINPDKKPKYIYIPKESKWPDGTAEKVAAEYNCTIGENEISKKLTVVN